MATPTGPKVLSTLAAMTCVVVVAACGSSNKPTSTTSAGLSSAMVKYSECMRSHGVSGFPDPSTSQGPNAFGIDGYNFNLPANLNMQSPAYEAADKTCGHLIGSSTSSPRNPALAARAKQAALAHAQCMRDHGVPNFPDPTFSASAQGITVSSGGTGINPRSPAFQQAQKICAPT